MPLRHRSRIRRIFVYCHDAFGMGNARRMMAIAAHLARSLPGANLLLASGSPVIHGFRMPDRVDYIKLPSVARTERERYATRYLTTGIRDTIRLRSALLTAAVRDFAPDLVLVDKKPFGIMRELGDAVRLLRDIRPGTKQVLVLRDILDAPAATRASLAASGFERDVKACYDLVAVLGSPEVFDMRAEYALHPDICGRVAFCGYLRSADARQPADAVRRALGVPAGARLVLVTPGGGEDGRPLLEASVGALRALRAGADGAPIHALMVSGPQLPPDDLARLTDAARAIGDTTVREFTDDMSSLVRAADLVVSMGGYNTVCDVLSLASRAIVVPRVRPVSEQWIRAERMSRLGYFTAVHPDTLTPARLAAAMRDALASPARRVPSCEANLGGLDGLMEQIDALYAPVPAVRPDGHARPALTPCWGSL
jgi:predicted glycosyltransferase